MGFLRSLRDGRVGEKILCELLESAGFTCESHKGEAHDITACREGSPPLTIEVKRDMMQAQTGNIAVEYHNPKSDKPSGLLASKADLWAIVLEDDSVWLTRRRDLTKFFFTEEFVRDIPKGGDGNASLRLFKSKHILDIFVRLEGENVEEVLGKLTNYC